MHIVYVNHRGQRLNRTCPSRPVAEELAKLFAVQLMTDPDAIFKKAAPVAPTFKDMSDRWLKRLKRKVAEGVKKQTTYDRYFSLLSRFVLPAIGSMRVDAVKKHHLIDIIEAAEDTGLSVSSLGLIRTCLLAPLRFAVARDHIGNNPAEKILTDADVDQKAGRSGNISKERFLTPEQSSTFLETCGNAYPEYAPFFRFLFMTGTRLGEAIAVTWEDIDWETKTVFIDKSYRMVLGKTKSGNEREVDMPDSLVDTLRAHQLDGKKRALRFGMSRSPIVFAQHRRHMRQNQARRVFKKVLTMAGLPDRRLHDTRHSYAALLAKNGASLDYIKRMLGHADIGTTSNFYCHLMPNRDRKQVNHLADLISPDAQERIS